MLSWIAGGCLVGLRCGELLSEHLEKLKYVSLADALSRLEKLANLALALGFEHINAHALALSAGHRHEDCEAMLHKEALQRVEGSDPTDVCHSIVAVLFSLITTCDAQAVTIAVVNGGLVIR